MPFPFKPKDDANVAEDAPRFGKKNFGNKRKNRKVAPTQKRLMAGSKPPSGGRSMSGGGR